MSVLNHYSKKAVRKVARLAGKQFTDIYRIGGRPILGGSAGSLELRKRIDANEPLAVSRFGTTEAYALEYCIDTANTRFLHMPNNIASRLSELSGFFPKDKIKVYEFFDLYAEIAPSLDIVACRTKAVFGNYLEVEQRCISELCPDADLIEIDLLYDPFSSNFSWIQALSGRNVLVIHPFAELIQYQYSNRKKNAAEIFLPDFNLTTMAPAQTLGKSSERKQWSSWFDALEQMKHQISNRQFDVALIAAGAYGPFLAHHCKTLGSIGIHIGGALQLYFHITGRRWDDPLSLSYIGNLEERGWIRPSAKFRPEGFENVEDGCYW